MFITKIRFTSENTNDQRSSSISGYLTGSEINGKNQQQICLIRQWGLEPVGSFWKGWHCWMNKWKIKRFVSSFKWTFMNKVRGDLPQVREEYFQDRISTINLTFEKATSFDCGYFEHSAEFSLGWLMYVGLQLSRNVLHSWKLSH